jgi:uncharacterized protein
MSAMPEALLDTHDWRRLDARSLLCRTLGTAIGLAVMGVAGAAVFLMRSRDKGPPPGGRWIALGFGAVLLAGVLLRFLGAQRLRFRLTPETAELRTGIIGFHCRIVPLGRVQHVDVQSGPIERLFDLATVSVHTAAGDSTIEFPCVPAAEAAGLRDRLLAERRRDGI